MVLNTEILEGLKQAVARGESLQKAMMTFFNAGYSREEIQEAARNLQVSQTPVVQPYSPSLPSSKNIPQSLAVLQKVVQQNIPVISKQNYPQSVQKISDYKSKEKGISNGTIAVLLVLLIFLVGFLFVTIFFKDAIIGLFSGG